MSVNAIEVDGGKGGPEAMHWVEVASPELSAGEVLIDIAATAVNRADLLQRQDPFLARIRPPEFTWVPLWVPLTEIGAQRNTLEMKKALALQGLLVGAPGQD